MSAEDPLPTPAEEGDKSEQVAKEADSEDKKGLMDEILEVISRSSMSEEERQSTPNASDERKEDAPTAKEGEGEVQEEGEKVALAEGEPEPMEGDGATQGAEEPLPAEEEAKPAGEEKSEETAPADAAASSEPAAGESSAPEAPEEGGKTEEGEDKVEPAGEAEPEVAPPPPVDITTSYLISTEDVLAKGISEDDVERFKRYHLTTAFGIQSWYKSLKEHTFETEFITLSSKQVEVLAAAAHPFSDAPELTDEQREVLTKLEEEIDTALAKFGENGAFIKLDTCSAMDSVLDRKDPDHIQEIKDAVVNEMEIEKQFANAYLIWRSWRSASFRRTTTAAPNQQGVSNEGRLRRSFRRIQNTFNRPRAQTATLATSKSKDKEGKSEDPLAEVTPKQQEEEEKKEEEKKEEEKKEEGEQEKTEAVAEKAEDKKDEAGGDAEASAVTVEVTVETTESKETPTQPEASADVEPVEKKEEEKEEKEEEASSPQDESQPAAVADKKEEVEVTTDTPVVEEQTKEEQDKEDKDGEKKEEKKEEEKEGEVKDKVEEAPAKESADEKDVKKSEDKEKNKPRSVKEKKVKPLSEEHASMKVKEEPTQNKVLRGLMRAVGEKSCVKSGKEAVQMLLTSARVKEELGLINSFSGHIEGYEPVLCVRRWNEQLPRYPGMQFRGFVYKNRLTALSQYDDMAYIPNIIRFKGTIQKKILSFFNAHIKRAIEDHDNYLIDVFVAPNQVYLIKLSPFHVSSGACLFTWREHKELLTATSRSFKFSVVSTPKADCFRALQSWWQAPLENIVQDLKKIEQPQREKKCTIL